MQVFPDNRVLVPCAHALRQPRGFHLSWNESLYRFARRRPQLTRGPTTCGHRRFELLASCVYAAMYGYDRERFDDAQRHAARRRPARHPPHPDDDTRDQR